MKTSLTAMALVLGFGAPAMAGKAEVLETYADIAHAGYEDSLLKARELQAAIETLLADPSPEALNKARAIWIEARVPYQQTEVYRFGNPIVDDWEGKVNAWPLDEGLIDYVDTAYGGATDENQLAALNVVANPTFTLSGEDIDASEITPELLADRLHEVDEVEANVATGYHAIEFLLWGQDLNGTGPGAGNRPVTDYDPTDCSRGNCERRARYLEVVTELLVDDLAWMVAQWAPGGSARTELMAGDDKQGLATILNGMGSLSYGELAGERMKLGLMLHDPEEEHDCFSDNTHASHFNDVLGIRNVYTGTYTRIDGRRISGPSVSSLVAARAPEVDGALRARLEVSLDRMQVLV